MPDSNKLYKDLLRLADKLREQGVDCEGEWAANQIEKILRGDK